MLWTSDAAAAATGGHNTAPWQADGVSVDAHTLRPGDLFVALKDMHDGHASVATALANGAAAALVSHTPPGLSPSAPLLIVSDVTAALTALATAARARTQAKVIGVTGSVGKTSTIEMLRAILSRQGPTHASPSGDDGYGYGYGGLPLTLSRMPADTRFAIVEITTRHPGQITPRAQLARLDLALITTVAATDLDVFGDIEAIAHEAAAIMDGLAPNGRAILPADLAVTPILLAKAAASAAQIWTFGMAKGADFHIDRFTLSESVTCVQAGRLGTPFLFKVSTPGRHFATNALAALAAAQALGCDPVMAAHDIAFWQPSAGRGRRSRILLDVVEETFVDLIDDTCGACPASMAASLEVLIASQPQDGIGRIGSGRRIAILGDMAPCGPATHSLHAAIARHPGLHSIDTIHCVGPQMRALHDALPRRQRGEWVATAEEIAPHAKALIDAGDIILVKGSHGSNVGLIVDALHRLGHQQ